MVRASSLCVGKDLGPDYRLRRLRGRGSFGSVWEAVTGDGQPVALKLMPSSERTNAAQEIRAIQFIKQLRHPNLTPIEQVWCYRGYIAVTMKLADGSLLDLLDVYRVELGTALPADHLCPLLSQAAAALDFLNNRQHLIDGSRVAIQHGDVKPSNMLLFGETVKLCDFGLASLNHQPIKSHRRAGTVEYAAPEVFRGWLSDHSDQYSLAVSYCQLRTGQFPFPDPPPQFDPSYVRPAPDLSLLAPAERSIIARALSRAPQERWPSCGEMMAELSKLGNDNQRRS